MFYYIPQIILFLSLVIAIWIVAKNFPKIKGGEDLDKNDFSLFFKKFVFIKTPIEKLDARFNEKLEKILRKFRIYVIKFDNRIQRLLNSVKNSTKQKSIFKASKDIEKNE